MASILITGGTGFIGSYLCDKLSEMGHTVIAMGSQKEQICNYHHLCGNDLNDLIKFKKIDYCFHQAAHNDTTDINKKYMFASNCLWSLNLFDVLKTMGCKKIIYASSASLYGDVKPPYCENMEENPLNVYAQSKQILEYIANDFGVKNNICMIGLRYFNVYGSREKHKQKRASMIYQLCKQAVEKNEVYIFKWGEQKRDWVSVHDVVDCNIKCLEYNHSDIFNVGSGEATSINEIIEIIKNNLGNNLKVNYIDNPYESSYQNFTLANIEKLKKKLNYCPSRNKELEIKTILDYVSSLKPY